MGRNGQGRISSHPLVWPRRVPSAALVDHGNLHLFPAKTTVFSGAYEVIKKTANRQAGSMPIRPASGSLHLERDD
jgi:hypothetical protein